MDSQRNQYANIGSSEGVEADTYDHRRQGYASTLGAAVGGAVSGRNPACLLSKHEESQLALQYVLNAIRGDVSIDALERAVATVKAHLEASA